jgi:crotonobetainyl-CoA:carnitine CoA-transferase CaiB-like acyl-CoA transferase
MSKLPLEGIRVIDATISWAGPFATNLLATMGAEVIHVESIQFIDPWRGGGTAGYIAGLRLWELSPLANSVNSDKLGITLDLTNPRGVDIFKRLVKISDVVAENYTVRVMKNFGLDYPVLKEVNPRIIMISLPANGCSGPWKDYSGYAHSVEQMAGISQLTGEPDGPPMMTGFGIADPVAGVNGAAALLMALLFRQATGKGQYIDLSQTEALTCLIGEAIAEASMNGSVQPRRGNGHPFMAPHGTYRCQGDDLWVSIAVASDEEWRRFVQAIGAPPWSGEERFADAASRWHHRRELDALIEEWTVQHDHYEVMNVLQRAGVAAGAVITSAELLTDPHLQARGTYQMIDRGVVGNKANTVPTAAMKFSKCPLRIRRPGPLLGEHNEYVLGTILGMSAEEIASLAADNVIGKAPLGYKEEAETG